MNRDGIKKLLVELSWDEIVRLALIDRRIIRTLLSLLYEADDYVHWLAIEALGRIGGEMAVISEEKTRELIRRLLWNLNDESGGTPWGATGAIGAIVARRPDLFGNYLSLLFPFYDDYSVCPEFIWSVAVVGRGRHELVAEYVPFLLAALTQSRAEIRGYAAWALGVVGAQEHCAYLAGLEADSATVAIYQGDGVYVHATVGAIARESIRLNLNRP